MTTQIGIYDHTIGENVIREMTTEEIANREAEIEAHNALQAQLEAAAAKREAVIAALAAAAGLEVDEVKAALGA